MQGGQGPSLAFLHSRRPQRRQPPHDTRHVIIRGLPRTAGRHRLVRSRPRDIGVRHIWRAATANGGRQLADVLTGQGRQRHDGICGRQQFRVRDFPRLI